MLCEYLGLKSDLFRSGKMSQEAENNIKYAKSKDRTDIPTYLWDKHEHYKTDILEKCSKMYGENIKTIKYDEVSVENFIEDIASQNIPCKIEGATDDWKVPENWSWESLSQKYGKAKMKIAESDSGKKIRVTMDEYLQYLVTQQDDNPLY